MKASSSLLFCSLVPRGVAFISPAARLAPGARRARGYQKYGTSKIEPSRSDRQTVSGAVEDDSGKFSFGTFWRGAIEGGSSFEIRTKETFAGIGQIVENIEKQFNEINSATTNYLNSISPAKTMEAGPAVASGGSPKDDKPDKAANKTSNSTSPLAASAVSANAAADSKATLSAPIYTELKPVVLTAANVTDAGVGIMPMSTAAKAGSASGTVQLDRPKKVQGVFDELQKKAVEEYKSSPVAVPSGDKASSDAVNHLPPKALILEEQLESLLKGSNFRPRKLDKEKQAELVNALKAMEGVYPADASPLADPALSGHWSVVYSSRSRVIRRALKGFLAALFKASDPRQVVDKGASTVTNACRARLRLTPLALRLAQRGSYRSAGEHKVSVEFPRRKGLWRRLLPCLMSGKVQAEVTYLSKRWRICRAGDATVAFRKIED